MEDHEGKEIKVGDLVQYYYADAGYGWGGRVPKFIYAKVVSLTEKRVKISAKGNIKHVKPEYVAVVNQ